MASASAAIYRCFLELTNTSSFGSCSILVVPRSRGGMVSYGRCTHKGICVHCPYGIHIGVRCVGSNKIMAEGSLRSNEARKTGEAPMPIGWLLLIIDISYLDHEAALPGCILRYNILACRSRDCRMFAISPCVHWWHHISGLDNFGDLPVDSIQLSDQDLDLSGCQREGTCWSIANVASGDRCYEPLEWLMDRAGILMMWWWSCQIVMEANFCI